MNVPEFEIITNIYDNPDVIREYALNLDYESISKGPYAGKDSNQRVQSKNQSYQKIKKFFNDKGLQITITDYKFRKATSKDHYISFIHSDSYDYQVVINLSNSSKQDGDCYYRHKPTNITYYDILRTEWDKEYSDTVTQIKKDIANNNLENFECIKKQETKYNEAIIIKSRYLHAPIEGLFGSNDEDCRLVEIYSINVISELNVQQYPFLWYFSEIIPFNKCEYLLNTIKSKQTIFNEYQTFQVTDSILNSIEKFVMDRIKIILHSNQMDAYGILYNKNKYDVTFYVEYYPEQYAQSRILNKNNTYSTLEFIVNLNTNSTGLNIYNPVNNEDIYIPCNKGTLFVYPYSWMYPIQQGRIINGNKYILRGTITII